MNFNVTLSDELAKEVVEKAFTKGVTPSHYLEILIASILIKNEEKGIDFLSYAQTAKEEAENLSKLSSKGDLFTLSDLPCFKQLANTVDLNGHTAPSTIKARIGRNFNKAVSDGSIKGVKRALNDSGALKFSNGSAVYEVF